MEKFLHHKAETSAETITLQPGESIPLHNHPSREEEYECMSGQGTVTVDGIEHSFTQSTRLIIPKGAKHAVRNTGTEPLQFFAINIPAFAPEDATFWGENN